MQKTQTYIPAIHLAKVEKNNVTKDKNTKKIIKNAKKTPKIGSIQHFE